MTAPSRLRPGTTTGRIAALAALGQSVWFDNIRRGLLTSGEFESWGGAGAGQWVTIYANGGHVFMTVAGLRFDTSGLSSDGTRWHTSSRSSGGYVVRHPNGL